MFNIKRLNSSGQFTNCNAIQGVKVSPIRGGPLTLAAGGGSVVLRGEQVRVRVLSRARC